MPAALPVDAGLELAKLHQEAKPDGSWERIEAGKNKKIRAQEALCERAQAAEQSFLKAAPKELKPQKPRPVSEGRP